MHCCDMVNISSVIPSVMLFLTCCLKRYTTGHSSPSFVWMLPSFCMWAAVNTHIERNLKGSKKGFNH